MKITEEIIPLIEKALDIKLLGPQREYLVNDGSYWYGGRTSGKTLAYCIKLALSDGEPLKMEEPEKFCDIDYGSPENKNRYARWFFRQFFYDVWRRLKAAGLPARELRF